MPSTLAVGVLLFSFFLFPFSLRVGAQSLQPDESIRIATDLVDLHVSVFSKDPTRPAGNLTLKDFIIFEDGAAQEIAFFAAAETPFDLVLLLDLSGSTSSKLNLIRKSAKRFVAAAPAADRIAVITFTDVPLLVAPLSSDRQLLNKAIDQIEKPAGGTNFWDSLHYVLESVLRSPARLPDYRRSAVIVMTDGIDNALPDVTGEGSRITFAELIQVVRASDAIVVPIYLDTEQAEVKRRRVPASAYVYAKQQLNDLAQESGNVVYRAAEVKDLDHVYDQVIRDLRTVYSLGYRPANRTRDGAWRNVQVRLPTRPDLAIRAKRGYYAK